MTTPTSPSVQAADAAPRARDVDWPMIALVAVVLLLGIAFALYASGASTGFVYDDV